MLCSRAFDKEHRAEKGIIEGLDLTGRQLFWVGWAQLWCLFDRWHERFTTFERALKGYEWDDDHAPGPWRVNTVLSNQKKFAEDFKCPVGSTLNPTDRCIVW